ncbi:Neutral/alkaline non-lysosomal ceramidase-domain-containing protein [Cladochytrium replicatum]|nr:Neutral/alkaline non-lysosomal ceramidase-domain-containing protein [Cladochytrium replicatum]
MHFIEEWGLSGGVVFSRPFFKDRRDSNVPAIAKKQRKWGFDGSILESVGVGSADITGQIGELALFDAIKYADLSNQANGIHLRVRARSFIFAASDKPSRRVVYISSDTGISSVRTKKLAISYLSSRLLASDAALYSSENVLISSTHTDSGPGCFQVPNSGRTPSAREAIANGPADAIANGLADAIAQAHADISEGKLVLTKGPLTNASINRSKASDLANPASERAQVDQDMTLLAISTADGGHLRDMVNCFWTVECWRRVAEDGGSALHRYGWGVQRVQGLVWWKDRALFLEGPEYETGGDTRSAEVIGQRQYLRAKTLVESPIATKVLNSAAINADYRHSWVEFPKIYLEGTNTKICKPAMPSLPEQRTTQGDNDPQGDNKALWNFLHNLLPTPSKELVDCQAPKQILLSTGEMAVPSAGSPTNYPFSCLSPQASLQSLASRPKSPPWPGVASVTVLAQLIADKVVDSDAEIVIKGLSNSYASYVTTTEEYGIQFFEGGATSYGPNTLKAHQQVYTKLTRTFATGMPATPTDAFPINYGLFAG